MKAEQVADKELESALLANRTVRGAVQQTEVDRLRLNKEKATLEIEQAKRDQTLAGLRLEQTQAELSAYKIQAPFEGLVTRVYKRAGEAVRQGDPIVEVESIRRVKIEGKVHFRVARRLRVGMKVTARPEEIDIDASTQLPIGHIRFIDVKVEPLTKKVRVWAEIENTDGILKPGLTATLISYE